MGQTPGGGTSLANAPPIPAPSAWNIPPAPGRRQRWGVRLGAARARGLGGAPSGLPCDSSLHATGLGRSREQEGGLPPSWGIRLRLLLEGLFSSGGAEVSPLAGPRPSAGRTGLRRLLAQPAAASPLRPAGLQTDRRRYELACPRPVPLTTRASQCAGRGLAAGEGPGPHTCLAPSPQPRPPWPGS